MIAPNMRGVGVSGFRLGILLLVLVFFGYTEVAAQSTGTGVSRFRKISGWKGTFSYRLDYSADESFGDATLSILSGNLSSQETERIEMAGEVTFTGDSGGQLAGQGSVDYEVELFSLTKWGNKSILSMTDGRGRADILPEIEGNFLSFDLQDGSYSFAISPGREDEDRGEFGVEARLYDDMEIIDPLLADLKNADREVPLSELLPAMLPEERADEGYVNIGIDLQMFPLPAFGNILRGTYTDYRGGILSWRLEPTDPVEEEFMVPVVITTGSDSAIHFHPPSQEDREGIRTLTLEREMARWNKGGPASPIVDPTPGVRLFVLGANGSAAETGRTACGRPVVGVDYTMPDMGGGDGQSSLMRRVAAHVSREEGGTPPSLTNQGLLNRTLLALQSYSPEDEGSPHLSNELYGRWIIKSVSLEQTTAVVHLTGDLVALQGCSADAIKAQLEETAAQFSFVGAVELVTDSGTETTSGGTR